MPERVRIFIDFWNLQLGWNHFHHPDRPKIPWDSGLTKALVVHAATVAVLVSADADFIPAVELIIAVQTSTWFMPISSHEDRNFARLAGHTSTLMT